MVIVRHCSLRSPAPAPKAPKTALDERLIPSGPFCYRQIAAATPGEECGTEPCCYWSVRDDEETGEKIGACAFLKTDDAKSGVGLLRDACKECGVRMDDEVEVLPARSEGVTVGAQCVAGGDEVADGPAGGGEAAALGAQEPLPEEDPLSEVEPAVPVCPVIQLATRLASRSGRVEAVVQVAFQPQPSLFPEFLEVPAPRASGLEVGA
jgi:hypothetical protein